MSQTPALERIAFQHQSSLAQKLVNLCQTSIDDLAKTNPNADATSFQRASAVRIDSAAKYLYRRFVPNIINIVKDELNLALRVVITNQITYLNAAATVIYKNLDGAEPGISVYDGHRLYSGVISQDSTEYEHEFFKTHATELDLTTGKLKTYSTKFFMVLWLYAPDFIPSEVYDPSLMAPFTAAEIAATILHEIGHAMTFIEHSADMYYRTDVVSNTVKYTNSLTSNETIRPIVEKLQEVDTAPATSAALQALKQTVNLSRFTPLICLLELLWCLPTLVFVTLERLGVNSQYSILNESSTKTSDVVVTRNNQSYTERLADEFVSRHGLLAAYISGFAKSAQMQHEGHNLGSQVNLLKQFGVLQTLLITFQLVRTCFIWPLLMVDEHTYDPPWLRYEHILQDAYVVFKDPELDTDIRTYYLNQIAEMQRLISDMKATKYHRIKQFIFGKLLGIFNRNSAIDATTTANLSADYDQLQLWTNGLIKNKLYYHAARLQGLMKAK